MSPYAYSVATTCGNTTLVEVSQEIRKRWSLCGRCTRVSIYPSLGVGKSNQCPKANGISHWHVLSAVLSSVGRSQARLEPQLCFLFGEFRIIANDVEQSSHALHKAGYFKWS